MKKKVEKQRKACPECNTIFFGRKDKIFCQGKCRFNYWAKRHPRTKIIC